MPLPTDRFLFISYSRQDSVVVSRIHDRLAESGISTWRDIDDIAPGSDWAAALFEAVEKSAAVLCVLSRNSLKSHWVMGKAAMIARQKQKPLIPVLIDDTPLSELPPYVLAYQVLDLTRDFEAGLLALLRALETAGLRPASRPVEAPRRRNKGYVFVSYAKEDRDKVAGVTAFFAREGYAYFDYKSQDRQFEADFDLELEERIRSAQLMTSIISPNWKKAVWPKKEYLFATRIGTPTFLLQFADPGPSILIIDRTPIDFSGAPDAGYSTLKAELDRRGL